MEHERGAFKVKLPDRATQLRNDRKFTSSIPWDYRRRAPDAKYRAGILVKQHRVHKK
jgi:hypothetical protein